tara:strand:+ start:68 stop:277 length:210 start_codon:yes stop_codon:yes gene_type:complete
MSEKKYTIQLTFEELRHIQQAINIRSMHYENDYVEEAYSEEDIEYEKKQYKIVQNLDKRITKKINKLCN